MKKNSIIFTILPLLLLSSCGETCSLTIANSFEGGLVYTKNNSFSINSNIKLNIKYDYFYKLESLTINGKVVLTDSNVDSYTFKAKDNNIEIVPKFKETSYKEWINIKESEGGYNFYSDDSSRDYSLFTTFYNKTNDPKFVNVKRLFGVVNEGYYLSKFLINGFDATPKIHYLPKADYAYFIDLIIDEKLTVEPIYKIDWSKQYE